MSTISAISYLTFYVADTNFHRSPILPATNKHMLLHYVKFKHERLKHTVIIKIINNDTSVSYSSMLVGGSFQRAL